MCEAPGSGGHFNGAKTANPEAPVIGGPGVTDAGLGYLTSMRKLEVLTISGDITDQGLHHLEGLKGLQFVNITSEGALSDASVEALRKNLPNLVRLRTIP